MVGCNDPEVRRKSAGEELTFDEIVDCVLKPGKELGARHIQYSGGEFLLRKDALDLIRAAVEFGYAPRVLTNATLITEELLAEIKRVAGGKIVLVFGLNSVADNGLNERTRDVSLGVVLRALDLCKRHRIGRHVVVNVGSYNACDLESTFQWLAQNRIPFNRSPFSARMSGKAHFGGMAFSRRDMQEYIHPALVKRVNGYLSYTPFFLSPELHAEVSGGFCNVTVPQNPPIGCWVGTWLAVSAEGDVAPCVLLLDELVAGNLREKAISDIVDGSLVFQRILNRHALKSKCGRCRYRITCGGCRALAYYHTGDYMAEDPTCFFEPVDASTICEHESQTNSLFLKHVRVASRSGLYRAPAKGLPIIDNYREGDEPGISRLFKVVFNHHLSPRGWVWRFTECPTDARPFIVLAKDGGRIMGHTASLVFDLKYHDTILRVQQATGYMIHPNYRGGYGGIATQIYRRALEGWQAHGVDCGYAFPNRAGYTVVKKLHRYKDFITIRTYFKRLTWRPAAAKRLRVGWAVKAIDVTTRLGIALSLRIILQNPSRGIRYTWVTSLDEGQIDEFWRAVKDRYEIMLVRDYRYLDWRYIRKPTGEYEILQAEREGKVLGIAVVKVVPQRHGVVGMIMECLSKDAHLLTQLLARSLLRFAERRVDVACCRVSLGDPLQEQLRGLGFLYKAGRFDDYSVYQVYTSKAREEDFRDPSKWHITLGDCDTAV